MFNSGRRSDITYERETCDCRCEMFDRNKKTDDTDYLFQRSRTSTTSEGLVGRAENPSGSTGHLLKKISVSELRRRKNQNEEKKMHPAVVELKHLLSSESKERVCDMKKKQNKRLGSRMTQSVNADDDIMGSLRSNVFTTHLNPEVREFNVGVSSSYREIPSTIPYPSIEFKKLDSGFSSKTNGSRKVEIKSQAPAPLQKKASYSYALTTQPSEPMLYTDIHRTTITSQSTIRQQYSMQKGTTPATLKIPQIHFELQSPAKQPRTPVVRFCEPEIVERVPSTVTEADKSIEYSVGTPKKAREVPNIVVPIETESQYEKTVRKNEEKSAKGGRFSTKFATIKIKNIVSVPGTECLDFNDQDSIVLGRYTPDEVEHVRPYLQVHNRFSEPPLLNREEIELIMNVNREVSAFEQENSYAHEVKSSAKTQRPTISHDLID